jgi:hypothetical protein
MSNVNILQGSPDIVNLRESRNCCFCGVLISKRKQMWKYQDGNYVCISCKTRFDNAETKKELKIGY